MLKDIDLGLDRRRNINGVLADLQENVPAQCYVMRNEMGDKNNNADRIGVIYRHIKFR